ncbi:MAG: DUF134 domain-containing protein [archaeon]
MPRPCIRRKVRGKPCANYFKPAGARLKNLDEIVLTLAEFEAIRLVDLDEIEQGEAGKMMGISQPTFSRLLKSARKKISESIIKGKAIRIES